MYIMYKQVVFSQTHGVICYNTFLCTQGFYMLIKKINRQIIKTRN